MAEKRYRSTFIACFVSIVNQALMNVTAILFIPFMELYGFQFWHLGIIIGVNFAVQMLADIVLTVIIDKVSFRGVVLVAAGVSVIGLILYGLVPYIFKPQLAFVGILLATVVFAFAGGMLEVIISPIIDNIPDTAGGKGAAMSLMHSFYAWGQMATVIIASLFIFAVGFNYWNIILFFFAAVPLVSFLMFLKVPLERTIHPKEKHKKKKTFLNKFFIAACLAILFGGASEIIMNQWTSSYLQLSFGLSKVMADIIGMSLFAMMLGVGRALYGIFGKRLDMNKVLIIGAGASAALYLIAGLVPVAAIAVVACILCGFTTSLLWPGTLVVAADRFPSLGAWVFAVLAICGDIGGAVMPVFAGGLTATSLGINLTLAIMSVCPIIAMLCHIFMRVTKKKEGLLKKEYNLI